MYKERYERLKAWVTHNKLRYALFRVVYSGLPAVVFAVYTIMAIYLITVGSDKIVMFLTVPGVMFVTLSAARKIIDRPRPYVKYNTEPIIHKNKNGESFPSRHTASAAAVACAIMYINIPLGAAAMAAAVLIGMSRVVGGVHYISDAAAGFGYALLCSCAYLFIK